MEKFINLPEEKQNTIINGALITFGTNGYKKSSVSDIANACGISKAMVFHYFGTKKALYLYLFHMCTDLIVTEINDKFDNTVTDFFDRILLTSRIKIAAMKKFPGIISFLTSSYFETDNEVKEEIHKVLSKAEGMRSAIAFDGIDTTKFKEGIDINMVLKLLIWAAEGFVSNTTISPSCDLDTLFNEYFECMNMLKNNFYKEEYL